MNNAALAHALESDLIPPLRTPHLRVVPASTPPRVIVPAPPPPSPQPRGFLQSLWLRLFSPPRDPRAAASDVGVFRALHEVGSDYLPSSGTWPSPRGVK